MTTLRQILTEVCAQHRVKPDDMAGPSHAKKLVAARRAYFWRARQETKHSFTRIAAAINKDHTTAVYQVHRVAAGVETVEPFRPLDPARMFPREIETLRLRAEGVEWEEIAARFGVKETTVRSYASSAKRKMQLAKETGDKKTGIQASR